ncbi:P2X purinoceptor,putative [Ixodes scapularis]|uniref:P2X purinoceptor,putative n=1 Tax=Ixodes scapularis TaxID=6945 RepID=B7PU34_IXOSC|nr:P2X purinoceptor,putative [Ixodes scapularis]|eukprot:XP_002405370.1 P2X purinoceptor,putative [Ixodes scapularis]
MGRVICDRVANELIDIFDKYGIAGKVITDDATNFAKAFRIYRANEEATDDGSDIQPKELTELLDDQDDAMIARQLPPHHRCAIHTLTLVLPTLTMLISKLEYDAMKVLVFCAPLVTTLLNGIQKSFSHLMNDRQLILAATIIPRFKPSMMNELIKLMTSRFKSGALWPNSTGPASLTSFLEYITKWAQNTKNGVGFISKSTAPGFRVTLTKTRQDKTNKAHTFGQLSGETCVMGLGTCLKDTVSYIFEYDTLKVVHISNKKIGALNRLIQLGGVIQLLINWDCNLDFDAKYCIPKYTFSRLDDPNAVLAKGWNFRQAH